MYVLQANDNSRAHFGDIMASFLDHSRVDGAVIQGWTRDKKAIGRNMDYLKVWCKGAQPHDSADRWGITNFLDRIVIGNIFITPDDYIFADLDGVLVLKSSIVREVIERLSEKLDYEDRIRRYIADGKSATQIYDTVGRW
ncbi:MAG: RraA family protein [Candidatus Thorarchaeota archaeon]